MIELAALFGEPEHEGELLQERRKEQSWRLSRRAPQPFECQRIFLVVPNRVTVGNFKKAASATDCSSAGGTAAPMSSLLRPRPVTRWLTMNEVWASQNALRRHRNPNPDDMKLQRTGGQHGINTCKAR
jgi:hypothetical protein